MGHISKVRKCNVLVTPSEVEFPHPKTGSGIPRNSQEFQGIPGNFHFHPRSRYRATFRTQSSQCDRAGDCPLHICLHFAFLSHRQCHTDMASHGACAELSTSISTHSNVFFAIWVCIYPSPSSSAIPRGHFFSAGNPYWNPAPYSSTHDFF